MLNFRLYKTARKASHEGVEMALRQNDQRKRMFLKRCVNTIEDVFQSTAADPSDIHIVIPRDLLLTKACAT